MFDPDGIYGARRSSHRKVFILLTDGKNDGDKTMFNDYIAKIKSQEKMLTIAVGVDGAKSSTTQGYCF